MYKPKAAQKQLDIENMKMTPDEYDWETQGPCCTKRGKIISGVVFVVVLTMSLLTFFMYPRVPEVSELDDGSTYDNLNVAVSVSEVDLQGIIALDVFNPNYVDIGFSDLSLVISKGSFSVTITSVGGDTDLPSFESANISLAISTDIDFSSLSASEAGEIVSECATGGLVVQTTGAITVSHPFKNGVVDLSDAGLSIPCF